MSTRIPTRRVGKSALAAISRPPTYIPRRNISNPFKKINPFLEKPSKPSDLANPVLENLLREAGKKDNKKSAKSTVPTPDPAAINDTTTIFKPEYEIPGYIDGMTPQQIAQLERNEAAKTLQREAEYRASLQATILDPIPARRKQFERKVVFRGLRRRGRLTHDVKLARTERSFLYRSQILQTSEKKLRPIMSQIAGKTLEEAFVQLRFSKKRVAIDVAKSLDKARYEATLERGMGLGAKEMPDGTRKIEREGVDGVKIELKDGTRKIIYDPTEMYIEQAWVGRSPPTHSREYRARGKVNMLTHRETTFSVILKEEKTRMRISEEIKKKRDNRKLWLPLPDRPVTAQRQYCLW